MNLDQALEELTRWERRAKDAEELLALYHPPHPYPEHHMCLACSFLGRPLPQPPAKP
jgi:hypothetical protein